MLSSKRIELAVVMDSQLFEAFDGLYRRTADIESFASQLEEEYEQSSSFDFDTSFIDRAYILYALNNLHSAIKFIISFSGKKTNFIDILGNM